MVRVTTGVEPKAFDRLTTSDGGSSTSSRAALKDGGRNVDPFGVLMTRMAKRSEGGLWREKKIQHAASTVMSSPTAPLTKRNAALITQ